MILVYVPLGECVDDVVKNKTNHQFISITVEHFMNSARVCWIIRKTVFDVYVCLNHGWRYEHNQFERRDILYCTQIKCAESVSESVPSEENLDYLIKDMENLIKLKKNNKYYAQIQCQMALANSTHSCFLFTHSMTIF